MKYIGYESFVQKCPEMVAVVIMSFIVDVSVSGLNKDVVLMKISRECTWDMTKTVPLM